jgi:hypothetical protein
MREVLEELEPALREWGDREACAMLALLAGEQAIDRADLGAPLRRALLVIAAEGDPHRELDPRGKAVAGFAADIDTAERRAAFDGALRSLLADAGGLPRAAYLLETLADDPELAWESLAVALLAEELGDES